MINYVIANVDIHCPQEIILNGKVLIENGKIKEIIKTDVELDLPVIDGKGRWLLPGFIDIHVNGGGGGMSIDGTPQSIERIVQAHAKHGTTGMLITTISVEDNLLMNSLASIATVKENKLTGAKILGIHLEGPFISEAKRGAHQKQYLKKPDQSLFDLMSNMARGNIQILSLAPELENSDTLIEHASKQGVIIGFAHSEANYATTKKAITKGMSICTHLFNGMNPLTHKEVGPVGAFLTTPGTYVEVISDGVHIDPVVMEIIYRTKSPQEIIIVTDAVTPAGTAMENFSILGVDLEVRGYSCYIPNTQNLAGSALTMNKAIKIFKDSTSCTLLEAINMGSLNPATLLNINNQKGSIEAGKDADLVITDKNFDVFMTIVEGQILYQA